MRAINHTVTGAVVGAVIGNPWLALPAAFMSHFLLDVVPHSGNFKGGHTSTFFKIELLIDSALSAAFLLTIALLQPEQWLLLIACGVLGAVPDLLWLPYWVWELQGKPREKGRIGTFLGRIQWSETPAGYVVEAVWLAGMLYLFFSLTV